MIPALIAAAAPALIDLFFGDEPIAERAITAATTVATKLTGKTSEEEQIAALRSDPELMLKFQQLTADEAITIHKEETKRLRDVNKQMAVEVNSGDAYVRRMRPTFGYIMAFSWLVQMGAISWVIVTDPTQAGVVIAAVASLGTMWTVGLSVLGLYVYKRSEDKKPKDEAAGFGVLGAIAQRIAGK